MLNLTGVVLLGTKYRTATSINALLHLILIFFTGIPSFCFNLLITYQILCLECNKTSIQEKKTFEECNHSAEVCLMEFVFLKGCAGLYHGCVFGGKFD